MSHLVSTQSHGYRRLGKSKVNPISARWQFVLALHLSGKKVNEISELSGYSPATIYGILKHEDIIGLRQQILHYTASEFEALFEKVVDTVKDKLESGDERVQLEAVNIWMKAHGKFAPKQSETQVKITAEDVVVQILNQGVPET